MIELAHPWALILLPLPLLIIWLAPEYKERKSSVKVPYFTRLVDVTGQKPQSGAVLLRRTRLQKMLTLVAWLCLVMAMAKPEHIGEPISMEQSARDLMIAVDLSGSMSVEDFTDQQGHTSNRLDAVKSVLQEFAKGRESDRLGLILFGDAPYLQAPFTADINTWLALLNETDIGMAGQSTAFGDAIGLAINVFEESKTDNRVLIVLTDGNDTSSKVPPIDAARVAASYNIKIYAIAVGDPSAVGEEKVDLEVLEQVAELTQGKSFQALDRDQLVEVYREINRLEPQAFDAYSYRPKTSVHHYPMAAFALLYLVALSIVSLRLRRQHNLAQQGVTLRG